MKYHIRLSLAVLLSFNIANADVLKKDNFQVELYQDSYLDILANDIVAPEQIEFVTVSEIAGFPGEIRFEDIYQRLFVRLTEETTKGHSIKYTVHYVNDDFVRKQESSVVVIKQKTSSNSKPIAVDDFFSVEQNLLIEVAVLDNDSDADGDALSINHVTQPAHGFTLVRDNTIVYSPQTGYVGKDEFEYQVSDSNDVSNYAKVNILVVEPENNAPLARNDSIVLSQSQSLDVDVLSNDVDDDGDSITIHPQLDTNALRASARVVGDKIRVTTNSSFEGETKLMYRATDGQANSNWATVTINVENNNLPPTAEDDEYKVFEGIPTDLAILSNDSDPEGSHLELLSLSNIVGGTAVIHGSIVRFIASSAPNNKASFRYQVQDEEGNTDEALVTILVEENLPPVVDSDHYSLFSGAQKKLDVLANDSDPNGHQLTLVSVQKSALGTFLIENNALNFTAGDTHGKDIISYTVEDELGKSSEGKIYLDIVVNNPPVIAKDFIDVPENSTLLFNPTLNDSDPDGHFISLMQAQTKTPKLKATVLDNNLLELKSASGFEGIVDVHYIVEDSLGKSSSGVVKVRVHPQVEPRTQVSAKDIAEGKLEASEATYIYPVGTSSQYTQTRVMNDLNNDGINDICFALSNVRINSRRYEANMMLYGKDGGLGKQVSVQELLSGSESKIAGRLVYNRYREMMGSHKESDLNGDGITDFVFDHSYGLSVYFGKASDSTLVDVTDDLVVFRSRGTEVGSILEIDMADVNSDGQVDLIVIPNRRSLDQQELRVYYGPLTDQDIDLFSRSMTPETGTLISGFSRYHSANEALTYHLADLNGDDTNELILGDIRAINGQSELTGQVTILWNATSLPTTVDLAVVTKQLDKNVSTVIQVSSESNHSIGRVLASADTNADGKHELLLGVNQRNYPATGSFNEINVVGSNDEWPAYINLTETTQGVWQQRIFLDDFDGIQDRLRTVLSTDINGDDYDDIVVEYINTTYVLLGGTSVRPDEINLNPEVLAWPHLKFVTGLTEHISSIDLNNDEFMDLLVTTKSGSKIQSFVLYGGYQYNFLHNQ